METEPTVTTMLPPTYDFELDNISALVKKRGYTRLGIQLPDGLMPYCAELAELLQDKTGAAVIIFAASCHGACDVVLKDTRALLALDAVIQFGHAKMPLVADRDTLFIELHSNIDIFPVLEKAIPVLRGSKVGLTANIQFVHRIDEIKKFLESKKIETILGTGNHRMPFRGVVLGCSFESAKSLAARVERFLYVGSGDFHPVGIELATRKPVLVADPFTNEIRTVTELKEKLLKQRAGAVALAARCRTFGILLGTKPGQVQLKRAGEIMRLLKRQGLKGYLFAAGEVIPEQLKGINVECWVSTVCPRLAIDDYLKFDKPMITPCELEIAVGKRRWEEYEIDEFE